MEILSVSIDKEALERLNQVQKKLGFTSRSKLLRNALMDMLKGYEELESLTGEVESVFVLTYKGSEKNHVSDVIHNAEADVKTELHQHNHGTCIDILVVNTSADKTRKLFSSLKKNKCIYSVICSVLKKTEK